MHRFKDVYRYVYIYIYIRMMYRSVDIYIYTYMSGHMCGPLAIPCLAQVPESVVLEDHEVLGEPEAAEAEESLGRL